MSVVCGELWVLAALSVWLCVCVYAGEREVTAAWSRTLLGDTHCGSHTHTHSSRMCLLSSMGAFQGLPGQTPQQGIGCHPADRLIEGTKGHKSLFSVPTLKVSGWNAA